MRRSEAPRAACLGTLLILAACGSNGSGDGSVPGSGSGSGTGGGSEPDTTPPRVIETDPPADVVGVPLDHTLSATFSEVIDAGTVDETRFGLSAGGVPVPGAVATSGRSVRFNPTQPLARSTAYTAVLSGAISDRAGNPLGEDVTWNFVAETDAWRATSTASAPEGRTRHTAVWTGSEMIVWGGETTNGRLTNTGGRYEPVNDIWAPTPQTGAPLARRDHTAVWTGTEMIVWGGETDLGQVTNTGARHVPGSAGWAATADAPLSGVPLPRRHHTAVWTGTEMIVWGGETGGNQLTNTGGLYRPDQWTPTAHGAGSRAPFPRRHHSAVWTGEEMIVWGGEITGGQLTNTGGRYRPSTNTWSEIPVTNAPLARRDHTAVWTGSEMVVWGGTGDFGMLQDGARYDPGTNTWTLIPTTDAPTSRAAHTSVWTGYEMIVWGGRDSFDGLSGGRYRPLANVWRETAIPNAPLARTDHTAVWTGSEMIVWGGRRSDTLEPTSSGGRYAP